MTSHTNPESHRARPPVASAPRHAPGTPVFDREALRVSARFAVQFSCKLHSNPLKYPNE